MLLIPEGIIRPVVSASVLACFIRYIFIDTVPKSCIIIKTKVLFLHVEVILVNFDYPVCALSLFCSQRRLNYLTLQYFGLKRSWWMRRTHWIWGAFVVVIVFLDLQLPVQSVTITTKVVSSNPVHGKAYSIQQYMINFAKGRWFSPGTPFPSPIKLTSMI